MSDLRCVIVTPERTEVDVTATSVTVPLFDGEMGILKNHSPLVGRLGYGVLRIKDAAGVATRYFVEGGFVQVADNVISVLTDRVAMHETITKSLADEAMSTALAMPNTSPDQTAIRDKAAARARAMQRVAK
ncbi:MAG: ATP synthase F1 subunit epsilon [Pirellulaceae bacterium]|nr:ATP synthase F1 subunit epsilon [Pirellulaceae bacterium]